VEAVDSDGKSAKAVEAAKANGVGGDGEVQGEGKGDHGFSERA
jgi:hypothetical protein